MLFPCIYGKKHFSHSNKRRVKKKTFEITLIDACASNKHMCVLYLCMFFEGCLRLYIHKYTIQNIYYLYIYIFKYCIYTSCIVSRRYAVVYIHIHLFIERFAIHTLHPSKYRTCDTYISTNTKNLLHVYQLCVCCVCTGEQTKRPKVLKYTQQYFTVVCGAVLVAVCVFAQYVFEWRIEYICEYMCYMFTDKLCVNIVGKCF